MTPQRILLTYVISVPVFFVIDMIWLGVIARGFYRKALEPLLTPNINWTAAFLFYFLFLVGVLVFALLPGLEKRSLFHTLAMAALFGFIIYRETITIRQMGCVALLVAGICVLFDFNFTGDTFSLRSPFDPIFFLVQGVPVPFKNFVISPVVVRFRIGEQSVKVENSGLALSEKGVQFIF